VTSSLVVETGAGVQGADSYASTAFIDTYWLARTHLAAAALWAAASQAVKDGAAREASAYIDGTWGAYFRGVRRGYVQGLLWPRTGARDDAGYWLPDLPACLQNAVAELSGRAVSSTLAPDVNAAQAVKSEAVGQLKVEYFEAGTPTPKITYGVVDGLLAPLLNGSQPGAQNVGWAWA
jgi:hypothetical protein